MDTKVYKIDSDNIDESVIEETGKIIRNGGLVAFPTETVYGLGANAFDEEAVKNIYKAKGRPSDNPLIVHFAEVSKIVEAVSDVPKDAKRLLEKFAPGPLTVILKKNDKLGRTVTAGLSTVAVRIPENKIARAFIKASGVPIAAPSANLSGKPSPTTSKYVIDDMMGRIEAIIDGGDCSVGLESTIVDLSEGTARILRPGGITPEQIREVIPDVIVDKHILESLKANEVPKCPGSKYKHYSPDADVVVVEGEKDKVQAKIKELLKENSNLKTGVITLGDNCYDADLIINAGRTNKEYAKNLFRVLREFDDNKIDIVFAEFIYQDGYGLAVKNRIYKSAGYNIIYV